MPDAVIVSTARSPIGRAMKGSLVSMRPDDLTAQMVRAALDKVPALNPHQIDDLILGCGQPGGWCHEAGEGGLYWTRRHVTVTEWEGPLTGPSTGLFVCACM